ncbi:MAG: hypothetical protein R2734_06115 [Nocardioides sp.]
MRRRRCRVSTSVGSGPEAVPALLKHAPDIGLTVADLVALVASASVALVVAASGGLRLSL